MLQVRATANLAKFAENVQRKLGPQLGQSFLLAAEIVGGEIRRQGAAAFIKGYAKGHLIRTFYPELVRRADKMVRGGVYTKTPYASILNTGGEIKRVSSLGKAFVTRIEATHYLDKARAVAVPKAQAIVSEGLQKLIDGATPPPPR